ncbi:twin-arginine translocase TatA/TatE family subunit [Gleimia europaea]|uniref:Sec-independent protein translocase protein TatA n=1 Tax=Gleimia europaea ACS-120-V-Col10b TaxID=883069 RepID=A0A9W5RDI8_9ACTO|nr:twin-arginine translocase TatA/TatE family subunit [Gleimia europaea]EPD30479.1 TatA/E family twin arginine-targeting protein translocase [Gleimia europaea ACS-120-V-Col10b]
MGAFKPSHIIVLLIILIIVFGASKLPDIAKNLGKSAKVLKKEMKELTEDEEPTTKSLDADEEGK